MNRPSFHFYLSLHRLTREQKTGFKSCIRDRLALGKCQEGLDIFCLPWEFHIDSHTPSPFRYVNFWRAKLPARKSLPPKGSQMPWKEGCVPPSEHEAAHPGETVWFPKAAAEGDKWQSDGTGKASPQDPNIFTAGEAIRLPWYWGIQDEEKRSILSLWETKDLLGTEVCVMFSAVPGLTMAVLSWLSARTLWAHFDQDVMSPFLFFKLTLLQQLNICSGCWRRWSRQLQTLNCPRTNAPKLCCFYLKGFLSIFYLYCLLLFAVLCHSVYFLWTLHVEQSQSIHMLDKHRSITYFSEQQN